MGNQQDKEIREMLNSGKMEEIVEMDLDVKRLITSLINDIKRNIEQDVKKGAMCQESLIRFQVIDAIYMKKNVSDVKNHRKSIGDELANLNAITTFISYMKILTDGYSFYPKTRIEIMPFNLIRNILWNYCDYSSNLCTSCFQNNLHKFLLRDLKKLKDSFSKNVLTEGAIVMSAVSILMNCAKAENSSNFLKSMSSEVEIILWYSQNTFGFNINCKGCLSTCSNILLAYIADENKSDVITAGSEVIQFLTEALKIAAQLNGHRYNGFSAEEIIKALTKLAINRNNSIAISTDPTIFYIIIQLMNEGDEDEQTAAVNFLGNVAFHESSRVVIRQNRDLMKSIKGLTNNSTLSTSVNGLTWMLRQETEDIVVGNYKFPKKSINDVLQSVSENISELIFNQGTETKVQGSRSYNKQDVRIMISHHLEDSGDNTIQELHRKLIESGYKVWIKNSHMGDDIFGEMYAAMKRASIVLVAISQKYSSNFTTRMEADCVTKMDKHFIPILVERGYTPDGWLGSMIEGCNLLDFGSGLNDLKYSELEKKIRELK